MGSFWLEACRPSKLEAFPMKQEHSIFAWRASNIWKARESAADRYPGYWCGTQGNNVSKDDELLLDTEHKQKKINLPENHPVD